METQEFSNFETNLWAFSGSIRKPMWRCNDSVHLYSQSIGDLPTISVNVTTCCSEDALAQNYVADQQEEGMDEGIILLSPTTQKNDAKCE